MTVRDVVRAIASSPEYTQRFIYPEAGESVPYERSVARFYRHILGRQPDPEGLRDYARLAQQSGPQAVVDRLVASLFGLSAEELERIDRSLGCLLGD